MTPTKKEQGLRWTTETAVAARRTLRHSRQASSSPTRSRYPSCSRWPCLRPGHPACPGEAPSRPVHAVDVVRGHHQGLNAAQAFRPVSLSTRRSPASAGDAELRLRSQVALDGALRGAISEAISWLVDRRRPAPAPRARVRKNTNQGGAVADRARDERGRSDCACEHALDGGLGHIAVDAGAPCGPRRCRCPRARRAQPSSRAGASAAHRTATGDRVGVARDNDAGRAVHPGRAGRGRSRRSPPAGSKAFRASSASKIMIRATSSATIPTAMR